MNEYINIFTGHVTAGKTDGIACSQNSTQTNPIRIELDATHNESGYTKAAIRCRHGFKSTKTCITFVGLTQDRWSICLDEGFKDEKEAAEKGDFKSSLIITDEVTDVNTLIWFKATSSAQEQPKKDMTVSVRLDTYIVVKDVIDSEHAQKEGHILPGTDNPSPLRPNINDSAQHLSQMKMGHSCRKFEILSYQEGGYILADCSSECSSINLAIALEASTENGDVLVSSFGTIETSDLAHDGAVVYLGNQGLISFNAPKEAGNVIVVLGHMENEKFVFNGNTVGVQVNVSR